jgi:hypothetical protein
MWTEKGEKSTKFFYSRYMERTAASLSNHVKIPGHTSSQSREQALEHAATWQEQIHTEEPISQQDITQLITNLPKITTTSRTSILLPVTKEDVKKVISQLPNSKTPGPDGIPYEFYKRQST